MQKEFKKHSFENGATDSFRKLLCPLQGPSGMASQECPTTSKAEIDDEEDEESEEEEEDILGIRDKVFFGIGSALFLYVI